MITCIHVKVNINIIVFGKLSRAQFRIDDVFDKEVRDKLKELKIIEDPENLSVLDPFNVHLDSTQAVVSPLSPF